MRWWRALPEEDRAEFIGVYGGDETLSRFVCALDYLTVMKSRPANGQTIIDAYAIACRLDPASEAARQGATMCWKHDAVQSLIDRLRYRSNRQAAARITNRTTELIEKMLLNAGDPMTSIKDQASAVKAAITFMKMVSEEDIQERVERTRRGFEQARKTLNVNAEEDVRPTEEQAILYLKMLRDTLGEEQFQKALHG